MLRDDIDSLLDTIPREITVVAATKYVSSLEMKELLKHGINNFGENRVDSFLNKFNDFKKDNVKWHFIGHLQRNKALEVVNKIDYLHSLDSLKLAQIINNTRTTPLKCFIEVSVNLEENKNGVNYLEINQFVKEVLKLKNIDIIGLMMMTKSNSTEEEKLNQFRKLKSIKDEINNNLNMDLKYLSMGMSDDYKMAIEAGSTHLRLGRILWKT